MQYDVFISCKSEDYQSAEVIYKFLEANGIHPFLASIELRKLGESEYRKAISEALKSSYHMIVFASKAEYIDSKWVYYEWDWFVTAKLKGIKPGQIVTFLKDVNINDVNADLWKYESFTFDNYKEKLLYYVETPEYQQRKEQERLENERKRQIIAEQERAEKAEQERIKTLQTQKDALTRRLTLSIGKVNREMKEMIDLDKKLGTEFDGWNKCPICGDDRRDSNCEYCETCGWFFVTPQEYVISKTNGDYEDRLQLSKNNWRLMQKLTDCTGTQQKSQSEISASQNSSSSEINPQLSFRSLWKKIALFVPLFLLVLWLYWAIFFVEFDKNEDHTDIPSSSISSLRVSTNPTGANVYVDGSFVGTAPISDKEVSSGRHTVQVYLDGYEQISETKDFMDKSVVTLNKALVKKTEKTLLYVTGFPTGANVYIDGIFVGTTPINGKEFSRGKHKVRVYKVGYETFSEESFFDDKSIHIYVNLVPIGDSERLSIRL